VKLQIIAMKVYKWRLNEYVYDNQFNHPFKLLIITVLKK